MPRNTLRCPTQWCGASTWPYIIVDDDRSPTSCAVVTISIHIDVGSLPLVRTQRTSSSRISAAVPGMVSRPASRRLVSHSRMLNPLLVTPLAISIGVTGDRQFGIDAALHADFGGAGDMRLPGPLGDLVRRQRVGVGIVLALREGA